MAVGGAGAARGSAPGPAAAPSPGSDGPSSGLGGPSPDLGGPVPVRPASTVMLVRDGARGVEVFTLRRAASLVFAAGMTVFPGGGVDTADHDASVPWTGPDAAWWAERWRIDRDAARGRVVAAVRELYEETGVLLAGRGAVSDSAPLASSPVSGPHAPDPHAPGPHALDPDPAAPDLRADLAAHRISLAAVLRDRDLPLRADLLRPWARWVTPPGPARRYDTYFFLAALPDGQQPDHRTSEAVAGAWQRPGQVLRAAARGDIGLMPPTAAMMTDLADAPDISALLTVDRVVEPVLPTVLTADGEVLRVRAAGREYSSRMRHG